MRCGARRLRGGQKTGRKDENRQGNNNRGFNNNDRDGRPGHCAFSAIVGCVYTLDMILNQSAFYCPFDKFFKAGYI